MSWPRGPGTQKTGNARRLETRPRRKTGQANGTARLVSRTSSWKSEIRDGDEVRWPFPLEREDKFDLSVKFWGRGMLEKRGT